MKSIYDEQIIINNYSFSCFHVNCSCCCVLLRYHLQVTCSESQNKATHIKICNRFSMQHILRKTGPGKCKLAKATLIADTKFTTTPCLATDIYI